MDDQQIVGLVAQGGIAGSLMLIIYKVGMALVSAIRDLRVAVDEHTKKDLAAMSSVQEDLAALNAKVDVLADVTPIRGTRQHERPASQPGYYPPRKPQREE